MAGGLLSQDGERQTKNIWTVSRFADRKLEPVRDVLRETVQTDLLGDGDLKHSAFSEGSALRSCSVQSVIR